MVFPEFDSSGNLPPGVYSAGLSDVVKRFGVGSAQRRAVAERLVRIYGLAQSTGAVRRFVIFGSFVTNKSEPKDIDIVILMEDRFDLSSVSGDASLLFCHHDAEVRLGASVFWTRLSGALGGEQAMVEYWQLRRDGGFRGIVEVI